MLCVWTSMQVNAEEKALLATVIWSLHQNASKCRMESFTCPSTFIVAMIENLRTLTWLCVETCLVLSYPWVCSQRSPVNIPEADYSLSRNLSYWCQTVYWKRRCWWTAVLSIKFNTSAPCSFAYTHTYFDFGVVKSVICVTVFDTGYLH